MNRPLRQTIRLAKRCLLLGALALGQSAWAGWVAYNDFGAPSHRDNSISRIGATSAELKAGTGTVEKTGTLVDFMELDGGAFYLGLMAAAHRVPFYPTRAGLGTAMLSENPTLKTVRSPYGDGEELVAIPAFEMDAVILHMNRADAKGNGQFLGPDLYFDDLFAMAGRKTYMSAEKIIPTEQFLAEGPVHTLRIPRIHVDGVVEAPMGAHFTECPPDYDRDEAFQREYAAAARDPEAWDAFRAEWLELESHEAYRAKLEERGR